MNIRYERSMTDTYLVLPVGEKIGYAREMILNNRIPGFLAIQKRGVEEKDEYHYRISSLISLEEYLESTPLDLKCLKQLIFSLGSAVQQLAEYLLAEHYLYLCPESIYIQTESTEEIKIWFLAYPDRTWNLRESIRVLIQYLMGKADQTDTQCAALCYELYGLLQKENVCLKEMIQVLENYPSVPKIEVIEEKKWRKPLFAFRRNSGILST